jgi:hypothetical protein
VGCTLLSLTALRLSLEISLVAALMMMSGCHLQHLEQIGASVGLVLPSASLPLST